MDILICGVGGQGTILTSKLLARAAMTEGKNVRTGETIGMSQRGGCVVSHVRIGDNDSPYIKARGADLLISFELCEGVRNLSWLRPGGNAVVSLYKLNPITSSLGLMPYKADEYREYIEKNSNAFFLDCDAYLPQGGARTVNVLLVGAVFGRGLISLSRASLEAAISAEVPEKYRELNLKSFECGVRAASGAAANG